MPFRLPKTLSLPEPAAARLRADYDTTRFRLPPDLRAWCLDRYGVDLQGEYAGRPVAIPIGKASGQLSLTPRQVRRDVDAGLGFVVLKTVIGEAPDGSRAMAEWATDDTHMRVDPIIGHDGRRGWTVTWKGRGWGGDLESYGRFFERTLALAGDSETVIAPSVKLHLPAGPDEAYREEEYRHTFQSLLSVWKKHCTGPMPLEKDFSPTLAGDARANERERILGWLRRVPELIHNAAPGETILGIKLMNARFDVAFQVEMLRTCLSRPAHPPEFLVYANRLFDPQREYEGRIGIAYGGPDLGARNLAALDAVRIAEMQTLPPISGTGDITTGRMAVEYALRGATSVQLHTAFQLPASEFAARLPNRTASVLHHLLLHPESGLIASLLHLGEAHGRTIHWRECRKIGRELATESKPFRS
jgi:hypothetical protein